MSIGMIVRGLPLQQDITSYFFVFDLMQVPSKSEAQQPHPEPSISSTNEEVLVKDEAEEENDDLDVMDPASVATVSFYII